MKSSRDLGVFERQQTALTSGLGQFDGLVDQLLGIAWPVQEGLQGDRCGAEELAEAEFHHCDERGAAEYDQQRRGVDERARRTAENRSTSIRCRTHRSVQ